MQIEFPTFGLDMKPPATAAEFVASERIAIVNDAASEAHFETTNPGSAVRALSTQFEAATTGQVDPKSLKGGAAVLTQFKLDSEQLATQYDVRTEPEMHAAYVADAQAADHCLQIVTALANELGIRLTTDRGWKR